MGHVRQGERELQVASIAGFMMHRATRQCSSARRYDHRFARVATATVAGRLPRRLRLLAMSETEKKGTHLFYSPPTPGWWLGSLPLPAPRLDPRIREDDGDCFLLVPRWSLPPRKRGRG